MNRTMIVVVIAMCTMSLFLSGMVLYRDLSAPDILVRQKSAFLATAEGRVGIGTTAPSYKLHLRDSAANEAMGTVGLGSYFVLQSQLSGADNGWDKSLIAHGMYWNPSQKRYDLTLAKYDRSGITFMNSGVIGFFTENKDRSARPHLTYQEMIADTLKMVITPEGNVGIGTQGPSYRLTVAGEAAGTRWVNLSSRDYKEGIVKVHPDGYAEMLAQLMRTDLARYRYKKELGGSDELLGFIAEEMPEAVQTKDGKAVDTYALMAYVIGALKAHREETIELREKVAALEAAREAERSLKPRGE